MINWSIRWKNKTFWLTIIPAILLLVQAIADLFGIKLELSQLQEKLLVIVNAVFGVLVILGIVVDPTTKGVSDSARAMTYTKPN
jgi:phi LC3 family holin